MKTFEIDNIHDWSKQNLITVSKARKSYDILKCTKCGIEGKRLNVSTITFTENVPLNKIKNCDGKGIIPIKIRVIKCNAFGEIFINLVPNSEHTVVDAPHPYKNDQSGVWVQGIGEPVKLLKGEYEIIS